MSVVRHMSPLILRGSVWRLPTKTGRLTILPVPPMRAGGPASAWAWSRSWKVMMRINGSMVTDEMQVVALAAGDVRGRRALHVVEPLATGPAGEGWAVTPPGMPVSGPPAGRPGYVARLGLVDRLEESVAAKLALVVAPAGWGKTSLLREWWLAGDRSGRAWLSVEAAHNDPARFW